MIVGNGAVLDGSAPVPVHQWTHVGGGVYRFRPPQMGFQQLFLDDRPAAQVAVDHRPPARPSSSPANGASSRATSSSASMPGKLPINHQLTYASLPTGITLFQVDRVTISGLTVRRYQTRRHQRHQQCAERPPLGGRVPRQRPLRHRRGRGLPGGRRRLPGDRQRRGRADYRGRIRTRTSTTAASSAAPRRAGSIRAAASASATSASQGGRETVQPSRRPQAQVIGDHRP